MPDASSIRGRPALSPADGRRAAAPAAPAAPGRPATAVAALSPADGDAPAAPAAPGRPAPAAVAEAAAVAALSTSTIVKTTSAGQLDCSKSSAGACVPMAAASVSLTLAM